jgi:oligopeptidase A
MTDKNPLLDFSGLPRFDAIKPSTSRRPSTRCWPEPRRGGAAASAADAVSWDSFVTPLENATELLGRAWGIVSHLNNVVDTPELRAVYNENQPKVTEFWTELGQNEALFAKYKALRASAEFATLSPARSASSTTPCAISAWAAPNCRKTKGPLRRHPGRTRDASTRFSENVLDATNDYKLLVTDEADLAGLPDDVPPPAPPPKRKASRLGILAALPVLLPDPAIRRQARTARNHLPRQRHQGVRAGRGLQQEGRLGQHPTSSPC